MPPKRRALLLATAATLAVAVLLGWGPSRKERMTIQALTTNMKTVCIGRYLIDVPQEFEAYPDVDPAFNRFMPPDMDFQEAPRMRLEFDSSQRQTLEQFRRQMQEAAASNAVPNPRNETTRKYGEVEASEELSPTAFLFRNREIDVFGNGNIRKSRNVEIWFWLDGLAVAASAVAYEPAEHAMVLGHLKKFIQAIKLYDDKQPGQPGFCLGPLRIEGRYSREEWELDFESKQRPDTRFSMRVVTLGSGRERTLLERANDPKNLLNLFDIGYSTLRKGKLEVAGMAAQQLAVRFSGNDRAGNNRVEHKFMLEVDPDPKAVAVQSQIDMGLRTGLQDSNKTSPTYGKELSATLSDEEALGLWDAVIKSIRSRPGTVS